MSNVAVPDDLKEKAMALKPDVNIAQSGDSWTISTILGDKTTDVVFKLNEPFDHQNLMGKVIKSTVVQEGDKLVETQTGEGETVTVTREAAGNELVSTLTAKGVSAIVRFQKA